jgi:WD40 repeat protein
MDIFDFKSKSVRAIQLDQIPNVTAVAISNDGHTGFIALDDGRIGAIRLADGQRIWEVSGHQRFIRCLRVSPAGTTLLSGADDGTLRLWDKDGNPLRTLAQDLAPISTITFSPDGNLIITNGGPGNGIYLWDLTLPIQERDAQRSATQARLDLTTNQSDPSALAELAQWYSLRGMADWERILLNEGHLDDNMGLAAARCRWELHDDATAAIDFKSLVDRPDIAAPDGYLRACGYAAMHAQ